MKRLKFATALVALLAVAASADVSAHSHGGGNWHGGGHWHGHHGHGHVGVFIGVPLGAAWYPWYPYRDVVTVPSPQVVYVEQNPAVSSQTAPLAAGWWYYCASPAGYYPYVQSCTQPWQQVQPQPPAP